MAEIHLQDFTPLPDAIDPADFFNVQRHNGTWKNYRTSLAVITGLETIIYEADFTIAELSTGPATEILPDPGEDQVYFIVRAWARYNPGSSNGEQVVKLTGSWFEQNRAFSAMLKTMPEGSAAAMYWEAQSGGSASAYLTDRNFRIGLLTTPGASVPLGNGNITIHIEYAVVAI